MSLLPRVTENARELVAREFDTRGPDVCAKEIIEHFEKDNPELLNMAAKCAADLGSPARAMVGFAMFYRLLTMRLPTPAAAGSAPMLTPLPRISAAPRCLRGRRSRSLRRAIPSFCRWRTASLLDRATI